MPKDTPLTIRHNNVIRHLTLSYIPTITVVDQLTFLLSYLHSLQPNNQSQETPAIFSRQHYICCLREVPSCTLLTFKSITCLRIFLSSSQLPLKINFFLQRNCQIYLTPCSLSPQESDSKNYPLILLTHHVFSVHL